MSKSYLKITYGYLKNLLDNPERYGAIKTGSKLFGVDGPKSDFDYFILEDDWYNIHQDIYNIYFDRDYYRNEEDLFKSVHFEYEKKIYNIIVVDEFEFFLLAFCNKNDIKIIGHYNF